MGEICSVCGQKVRSDWAKEGICGVCGAAVEKVVPKLAPKAAPKPEVKGSKSK